MTKKKGYSRVDIVSLVVGSIIGWGSFSLPGTKFLGQSGVLNASLGFTLGMLAVLLIQVGYHIMLEELNEDGGEFSYTLQHLGPKHGFVVGWSLVLCYLSMIPLNATAIVLVLAQVFKQSFSIGYLYTVAGYPVYLSEVLISALVIIVFGKINIRGIHLSAKIQNIMVFSLLVNVAVILCYMLFRGNLPQFQETYILHEKIQFVKIAPILAIVPFLFVGFDVLPQVTSDLGFSKKKAAIITSLSVIVGAVVYMSLNLITALAYTPAQAAQENWATGQAVLSYMGSLGFVLLVIALFAAVTGGINGFMVSSSRILSALASKRMIPQKYEVRNAQHIPEKSVYFVCAVSMIGPFVGRVVILYIVDMASVLAAIVYSYVCYIALGYAKTQLERILTFLGLMMGLSFILLLLCPGSPSQLGKESFAFLIVWGLLGAMYYKRHGGKYEK